MLSQMNQSDTKERDHALDEEMVGILTAISVVSKRLARKIMLISREEKTAKGGNTDEQKE